MPHSLPPDAHAARRRFLKSTGLSAMTAALGAAIPFHAFMPDGLVPIALAQQPAGAAPDDMALFKDKEGLTLLGDRPLNAETPPHLLDDNITPTHRHFVRNNGFVPAQAAARDAAGWKLKIDGEVERELELSIEDLKKQFEVVTRQIVLECAGNGRGFFNPPVSGNQWTLGGVGCSAWTGVRLRDVLRKAGVKMSAVYTGHYGADVHLSRDPSKQPLSRGVPIDKALDEDNLIAFQMNGKDIHPLNGFPLRLVIPGYPASCSQKWLTRIWVRDRKHDGAKMPAPSYSMPKYPVAPGTEVPLADFETITAMPVKSLITRPQTGVKVPAGRAVEVGGHAWVGEGEVARMEVSLDFGQTWKPAKLEKPANVGAWQHWSAQVTPPVNGYYEVWARATDDKRRAQPPVVPGWNPEGYLNNIIHRIAIFAV